MKSFKQELNHGLVLKKVYGVIKFNQNAWLKPYIDMNTDLRKAKMALRLTFWDWHFHDFENDIFRLINNAFFGKTIENLRKHRDIKLVTKKRRRNYLLSEPNYHTTKSFTENLLAIEMKKGRYIWMDLSI